MGKAMVYCLIGAAVILLIFLYFLIGMWLNALRKRLGMDKEAPFAWIKLVILIDGTLELLGHGLYTGLYLKIFAGEEAAVYRAAIASNWIIKGIIIGLIVVTLIVHIVRNIHSLGLATGFLFLHLIVDPIALVTPKDEVKELDQQYVDAIARQELSVGK